MSRLERDLKDIVRRHPETEVRYESPSGPWVRSVLWEADEGTIIGQTYWCADTLRWVTRAFDTRVGEASIVIEHPVMWKELSASITRVIDRLRDPALADLAAVAPELADVVRALREQP